MRAREHQLLLSFVHHWLGLARARGRSHARARRNARLRRRIRHKDEHERHARFSRGQQVNAEQQTANSLGFDSTPTIVVQGPKGQAQPLVGDQPYSAIEQAIQQVS